MSFVRSAVISNGSRLSSSGPRVSSDASRLSPSGYRSLPCRSRILPRVSSSRPHGSRLRSGRRARRADSCALCSKCTGPLSVVPSTISRPLRTSSDVRQLFPAPSGMCARACPASSAPSTVGVDGSPPATSCISDGSTALYAHSGQFTICVIVIPTRSRSVADYDDAAHADAAIAVDEPADEPPPFITRGNDALFQRWAARRTAGNRRGRRSACRSAQRRTALSPVLSDHRWPGTIGEHLLVIRQNARTESCLRIVRLGTERRVARRLASDADPPPERAWRRRRRFGATDEYPVAVREFHQFHWGIH